jgi:hypothetical protein
MGSWWRSEEMTYVSLILSEEAAPACVRELGILVLTELIRCSINLGSFVIF